MRKLVICASIAISALACSPAKQTGFKSSMLEEIMVGGKTFALSNFTETCKFDNGNRLLEHVNEKGAVTIILLGRNGKPIETGTVLKNGGANDAFLLVFEANDGRSMELTKKGVVLLRPLGTPSKPIENLHIR